MAQRLTDAELGARVREANRRRGQRMRERLVDAGRSPLTVWIPTDLRSRFVREAASAGININELAERCLDAALAQSAASPAPARTPSVDTLPLFDAAVALENPDDRLARILALKREQPALSNYAIADRVGCSEPTVRRELKRVKAKATV